MEETPGALQTSSKWFLVMRKDGSENAGTESEETGVAEGTERRPIRRPALVLRELLRERLPSSEGLIEMRRLRDCKDGDRSHYRTDNECLLLRPDRFSHQRTRNG